MYRLRIDFDCPRTLNLFYIVFYHIKWVKASWAYSMALWILNFWRILPRSLRRCVTINEKLLYQQTMDFLRILDPGVWPKTERGLFHNSDPTMVLDPTKTLGPGSAAPLVAGQKGGVPRFHSTLLYWIDYFYFHRPGRLIRRRRLLASGWHNTA